LIVRAVAFDGFAERIEMTAIANERPIVGAMDFQSLADENRMVTTPVGRPSPADRL
jgi:hypothetical protein